MRPSRWSLVLAAVLCSITLWPVGSATAAVPSCPNGAADPGGLIREIPWAQKWFDPVRIQPLANGSGQTIALLDTGVDDSHPQLRGRVEPGWDLVRRQPGGNVDCTSHGTAVASLIAAQPLKDIGLRGLAPAVQILPIRVSDSDPDTSTRDARRATTTAVAAAIEYATREGVTVIDVSPSFAVDDQRLRAAVQEAITAGIVVVAAVGDRQQKRQPGDPLSYPASYPGVIGVGSVDQSFDPTDSSDTGVQVRVTAPGDSLTAATRVAGYSTFGGTSFAAAYVAATAALVRQTWPSLTPRQVAEQIVATADPAPAGQLGPDYGSGIINPFRAITEPIVVSGAIPVPVAGLPVPVRDPAGEERERWWNHVSHVAVIATGATLALLILLTAGILAMMHDRGRRWSPERAQIPASVRDPDATAGQDESDLFALPSSPALRE